MVYCKAQFICDVLKVILHLPAQIMSCQKNERHYIALHIYIRVIENITHLLGASQSTQWLFPGIVFLIDCMDVGFTADVIRPD